MDFSYHRPDHLDTAADLVAAGGRVLAGGQSLMPLLKRGAVSVASLVDINRLAGLDAIALSGDRIRIGALARLETIRLHPLIRERAPLLAEALACVANPAIRQRGTLVGNLVLDAPGAEAPAVARLAEPRFECRAGERRVDVAADAVPGETLVTAVTLKAAPPGTRAAFLELQRRHGHLCTLGCGIEIAPDQGIKVVIAGYCAAPLVGRSLARALADGHIDDASLSAAAERDRAGEAVRDDIHADAAYRRAALPALVRRTLDTLRAREAGR